MTNTVVHTFHNTNKNAAMAFSAILAVDKGVPSDLVETTGGWDVVADDAKVVRFLRA